MSRRATDWRGASFLDRKDEAAADKTRALALAFQSDFDIDSSSDDGDEQGSACGRSGCDDVLPHRQESASATVVDGQSEPETGSQEFFAKGGRIYNYKVDGAERVVASSIEDADRMLGAKAESDRLLIHGLGAGGNKAASRSEEDDAPERRTAQRDSRGGGGGSGDNRDGGGSRRGGRGRSRGRGRGRGGSRGRSRGRGRGCAAEVD